MEVCRDNEGQIVIYLSEDEANVLESLLFRGETAGAWRGQSSEVFLAQRIRDRLGIEIEKNYE